MPFWRRCVVTLFVCLGVLWVYFLSVNPSVSLSFLARPQLRWFGNPPVGEDGSDIVALGTTPNPISKSDGTPATNGGDQHPFQPLPSDEAQSGGSSEKSREIDLIKEGEEEKEEQESLPKETVPSKGNLFDQSSIGQLPLDPVKELAIPKPSKPSKPSDGPKPSQKPVTEILDIEYEDYPIAHPAQVGMLSEMAARLTGNVPDYRPFVVDASTKCRTQRNVPNPQYQITESDFPESCLPLPPAKVLRRIRRRAEMKKRKQAGLSDPGTIKPYVRVVAVIITAPSHLKHRIAIRAGWMSLLRSQDSTGQIIVNNDMVVRFVVGLAESKEVNAKVEKEAEEMGDIVILKDCTDRYELLSEKVALAFEWAVSHYRFTHLVKVDDDVFIHPTRLLSLLEHAPTAKVYLSSGFWGKYPYSIIPEAQHGTIEYIYGSGSLYLLSGDLVLAIVQAATHFAPASDDPYSLPAPVIPVTSTTSSKEPDFRVVAGARQRLRARMERYQIVRNRVDPVAAKTRHFELPEDMLTGGYVNAMCDVHCVQLVDRWSPRAGDTSLGWIFSPNQHESCPVYHLQVDPAQGAKLLAEAHNSADKC